MENLEGTLALVVWALTVLLPIHAAFWLGVRRDRERKEDLFKLALRTAKWKR